MNSSNIKPWPWWIQILLYGCKSKILSLSISMMIAIFIIVKGTYKMKTGQDLFDVNIPSLYLLLIIFANFSAAKWVDKNSSWDYYKQ